MKRGKEVLISKNLRSKLHLSRTGKIIGVLEDSRKKFDYEIETKTEDGTKIHIGAKKEDLSLMKEQQNIKYNE